MITPVKRVLLIIAASALLVGCVPEPVSAPAEVPVASADPIVKAIEEDPDQPGDDAVFLSVIDGDTVRTSAGTVRIIGIDSPERGECGYDEASMSIGRLLTNGDPITLELPAGQNDTDRHDRLLRYIVTAEGIDLGMHQIESGNAIARYDSRDGYPAHPHEDEYRAAQIAERDADGGVLTTTCQAQSEKEADATDKSADAPTGPVASGDDPWWQQYSSCTRLKRNEQGHPKGPFDVNNPDEHEIYMWFAYGTGNRGDGDGDGLACE